MMFIDYSDFKYPDKFDLSPKLKEIFNYSTVVWMDIAPSVDLMEYLGDREHIVYDHHESSLELLDMNYKNLTMIHSLEKCGTKIVFDELSKGKRIPVIVGEFVNLVDTYDRFQKKHILWNDALNLNRAFYSSLSYFGDPEKKYELWIKTCFSKFIRGKNNWFWTAKEIQGIEKTIGVENTKKMEGMKRLQIRTDKNNKKWAITFLDKKISIVADYILENNPELDYLVAISTYSNDEIKPWSKLSVRSIKDDFNIPSYFIGVRGHKSAGGGEFDPKYLLDLYKDKTKELDLTI